MFMRTKSIILTRFTDLDKRFTECLVHQITFHRLVYFPTTSMTW